MAGEPPLALDQPPALSGTAVSFNWRAERRHPNELKPTPTQYPLCKDSNPPPFPPPPENTMLLLHVYFTILNHSGLVFEDVRHVVASPSRYLRTLAAPHV